MFKKLKDKLTEEVQQLSQLSPFTAGSAEAENYQIPQGASDELLVDISTIKPAGFNKDLFSIDEDSREEHLNMNSEFQTIELTEENEQSIASPSQDMSQFSMPFEPGASMYTSNHKRRGSESSCVSDASNLFPLYEVPNVSFNFAQCEVESCASEWDEGNSPIDKLSKDAIYQAYGRMKRRYHKYKGRYADLSQAFKEKDKEIGKIKEVLTKTQDKAVRRISELREQCTLEQQAKAHLEQEFRNDLEEKDHKISAMQTKVKLLQDGCLYELNAKSHANIDSSHDEEKTPIASSLQSMSLLQEDGEVLAQSHDDVDTLSVGSFSSICTTHLAMESEELIDKLKGDVAKHKALLSRCKENIKVNKERIATLTKERDLASSQLQERNTSVEAIQVDHSIELESLRTTVESSALSMAETKQHMFKELQTKESEVEHYRGQVQNLQSEVKKYQTQLSQLSDADGGPESVKTDDNCIDDKCKELEELVCSLQLSKKSLEFKLQSITATPIEPVAVDEVAVSEKYPANCEIEATQSILEDKLSNLNGELELSRSKFNESSLNHEKLNKLHRKLEVDINSKDGQIAQLVKEKELHDVHVIELNSQIDALQKQNASIDTKLTQSLDDNSTLSSYKNKIEQLQTDIAISSKIHEKLSEEIASKDSLISELQKQNTSMIDLQRQVNATKADLDNLDEQYFGAMQDLSLGREALLLCNVEIETKKQELSTAKATIRELNNDIEEGRSKTEQLTVVQEKLLQSESEISSFQVEVDILKVKIAKEETIRFEMQELLCNYGDSTDNSFGEKYNNAVSFKEKLSLIIYANKDLFGQVSELTSKQTELVDTVTEKDNEIEELRKLSDEKSQLMKSIEDMQKELSSIDSNLNEKESENVSLRNELGLLTENLKQSKILESTYKNTKEAMEVLQRELLCAQSDKDQYAELIENLESRLVEKDDQNIDVQKHLEEKNMFLEKSKLDLSSKETEICNLYEKISDMESQNGIITKNLSEKTSLIDTGEEERKELVLKLKKSLTELDELTVRINTSSAYVEQLESHISDLQKKLEDTAESAKAEITSLAENLSSVQKKLVEIQRENAECMANRETQYDEERRHTEHRLAESNAEISRLEREHVTLVTKMETAEEKDTKLLKDQVQQLETRASSMDEREKSLLAEMENLKEQLSNETKSTASFKENAKQLEEENEKLNVNLCECKLELDKCLQERSEMYNEKENLNYSLKQIIRVHERSLEEKTGLIKELQEKSNDLEKRIIEVINSHKEERVTNLNEENSLLKKHNLELSEMQLEYTRIAEEKQVLESKLEEISNENCLLTDDVKKLNINNEKLKENAGSQEIIKEEQMKEIYTLTLLCSKYEEDIKSSSKANEQYTQQSIDSSQSIASLSSEKESLLAELSKLKSIEEEFSELREVEAAVRLSKSTLVEELENEKLSKLEMVSNIENLKEKLITADNKILHYTEVLSGLEITCRNLGLRSDVTSGDLDLKSTLTSLVEERNKLSASYTEELSKNKSLTKDLDVKLIELQATNGRVSLKENELSNLTIRINDLEIRLRNTEKTKKELESIAAVPPAELSYKKEELEERLSLAKSEVRAHYEGLLENLHETHLHDREELISVWEDKALDIWKNAQEQMKKMAHEWSNERKELERLTTVAAEAFRNGTESVELLKQQVQSQRKEIDSLNQSHRKEIARLQHQLLSNFTNGSVGTPLENAAEFDYLRNVLYEYMIGNETQTLAKVLCAVVKFDEEQEKKIIEIEERKKSVISNLSNSLKAG